jgi:MoaA/NifB/PqqE/SkfB family radical SAM enzyme
VTHKRGAQVADYGAPLFLAWQLTNHCTSFCLHCCEESGHDKAWKKELSRDEALSLSRQIVEMGIPYVAFGGGEPLFVNHVWEVFEILSRGGTQIKIETNGLAIDQAAVDRLKKLGISSIQISVDGASQTIHERVRPEGSWEKAVDALKLLVAAELEPELVFVPTRLNIADAVSVYDFAQSLGVRVFVTGPMMRLGRAAASWEQLSVPDALWEETLKNLHERARFLNNRVKIAAYPWGIQREAVVRLENPQAMVLIVPDGKVKLLNALPFYAADLRKENLAESWEKIVKAWKSPVVRDFILALQNDPALLRHANECWSV